MDLQKPLHDSLLHGGDYNPDQWLDEPGVLEEDRRLAGLARCNAFSVNIFGWMATEPQEGKFNFDWLDRCMDQLHADGRKAILATPSGAKPVWMSLKYPEIRRVNSQGIRDPHQGRHNHCYSSPVYREKTRDMARRLAERYKNHPALMMWHVNNEFNAGECFCDFCLDGFRAWLKERYGSIEGLNKAWWTAFWASGYTSWNQVEPYDREVLGMQLDWRRFITANCISYFKNEIEPLRELTPHVPVTTNFMGTYDGLDYWKISELEDIASWDSYPQWQVKDDVDTACWTAFVHDLCRSFKRRPFLLMESTPSNVNWADSCKLKQPGMHEASSLQAIARGSDSVLYFQWRKSRGSFEQHHGAVVDHVGHEHTRVFREVARLGESLEKIRAVAGSGVKAEVALLYDWENRWALQLARGFHNRNDKGFESACQDHYRQFWRRGIAVDMVSLESDLSGYKVLVAPLPYLVPEKTGERIAAFVKMGGTLVTTYLCAAVDERSLSYLGGLPGAGLRKVLGLWAEETDALAGDEDPGILALDSNDMALKGRYSASEYAERIHLEGAQSLAEFAGGPMMACPALTRNSFGKGQAYWMGTRPNAAFLSDFYGELADKAGLERALEGELPEGVEAGLRRSPQGEWLFLINYREIAVRIDLGSWKGRDLLHGQDLAGEVEIPGLGMVVGEKQ